MVIMAVPADDVNELIAVSAALPSPLPQSSGSNLPALPEPNTPIVGDDLRIKPALAAIERAYIAAAMTRANGNQTVAARLLGLSRFGLQKKLRRLANQNSQG